jgi:disintegrin and metalloproteinase domain-containing protein 10
MSQWMDTIQNSPADETEFEINKFFPIIENNRVKNLSVPAKNSEDFRYPYQKYSKEANWRSNEDKVDDEWHSKSHDRVKRATRPKDENRNTCSLFIQTDPLIWRHIRENIADVSTTLKKPSHYLGYEPE